MAAGSEGDASTEDVGTRERILHAALREFSDKGFAGARVRTIADAARSNLRMIYHYFGNKQGLYRAVFQGVFEQRVASMSAPGETLPEVLCTYQIAFSSGIERLRMLQWEALEVGAGTEGQLALERQRRNALAERIAHVAAMQRRRPALAHLDTDLLYLALTALAVYPSSFPGTTRLITGDDPSSPEFEQRYRMFLKDLGQLIESIASEARVIQSDPAIAGRVTHP